MPRMPEGERGPEGHLDDGELHAFLDGQLDVLDGGRAAEIREHVDGCRACRDRLAVESAVRDRADALLAGDDPLEVVALPSFERLRAEAGRDERAGGGVGRRAAWAWAATVVISLGVGYGVGVLGPGGIDPEAPALRRSAPAAEAPAASQEAVADEAEEAAAVDRTAPAAQPPAASAPEPSSPVPPPTPEPSSTPRPVTEAAAGGGEPPVAAMDAAPPPVAARVAPTDSIRRPDADVGSNVGMALRREADAPTRSRMGSDAAAGVPAVLPLQELPLAEAEKAAVDLPLALPGLTIEELRWREVWPGQEGLVVTQRLPDGRRVELRLAGPSVGGTGAVLPPPVAPLEPVEGWSRATREVRGGWAALDGPLGRDELLQLLEALR